MAEYAERINPQVGELEVGIRHLRTIKIYPLSVGDQLELSEVIAEALGQFFDKEATEIDLVMFIVDLIKQNLKKILKFVVDEDEKPDSLLKDMTNAQAINAINMIYEMNYGENLKNAKSLFGKVKNLFVTEDTTASQQSLQPSVKDTGTNSETSSNHSEKAD